MRNGCEAYVCMKNRGTSRYLLRIFLLTPSIYLLLLLLVRIPIAACAASMTLTTDFNYVRYICKCLLEILGPNSDIPTEG